MKNFHYTEPNNLDSIACDWDKRDYEKFVRPLFHGTRRYALDCPKEELALFKKSAAFVISYVKKIFFIERTASLEIAEKYIEKKITETNEQNYFVSSSVFQFGRPSFSYNSLYLTTSIQAALTYSKNGGGEIGQIAYDNAIALRELNFKTGDNELDTAIDNVISIYPKFKNSCRVILAFENVLFCDLKNEDGYDIILEEDAQDEIKDDIELYFYNTEVTRNKGDCGNSYDENIAEIQCSFRLVCDDYKYEAKLIPEKLFKDAWLKFTKCEE